MYIFELKLLSNNFRKKTIKLLILTTKIMKKNYTKMFSIFCLGLMSISSFAQGTWKVTGTEAAINASTAIETGITGLTVMHSDAATVIGKGDAGEHTVVFNGVTWDNQGIIQGSTNGMYYAFRPTSNGIIDVSGKMGSGKTTFFLELTDACPDNADLAALTTNLGTGAAIYATPANFVLPTVTNSIDNTTSTWNGTVAVNTSGANTYNVLSFPVSANKTYVFGVNGSKFMLRGINYKVTSGFSTPNSNKETFSFKSITKGNVAFNLNEILNVGIYNTVGALMIQKTISPLENNVNTSSLLSGVYFIKDMGNNYNSHKLIVE